MSLEQVDRARRSTRPRGPRCRLDPAVTIQRPSGLNAGIADDARSARRSLCRSVPVRASHTIASWSRLAVTTRAPSGEKSTEVTTSRWPRSTSVRPSGAEDDASCRRSSRSRRRANARPSRRRGVPRRSRRRRRARAAGRRPSRPRSRRPRTGRASTGCRSRRTSRSRGCRTVSQIRTVPSAPAVTTRRPPGRNAAAATESPWPRRVARASPSPRFQTRAVPSRPAVTTKLPFALKLDVVDVVLVRRPGRSRAARCRRARRGPYRRCSPSPTSVARGLNAMSSTWPTCPKRSVPPARPVDDRHSQTDPSRAPDSERPGGRAEAQRTSRRSAARARAGPRRRAR